MILKNETWSLINTLLTSIDRKFENPVKFYNKENKLAIFYEGSEYFFDLAFDEIWDFSVNEFAFKFSNLDIFSEDIEITLENELIIFSDGSTKLSCKRMEDYFLTNLKFKDEYVSSKITLNTEELIDILDSLSNTYANNVDDFSYGIYIDEDTLFSTNKISSTIFKKELGIGKKLVISLSFLSLLKKLNNLGCIQVELSTDGLLMKLQSLSTNAKIIYYQKTLNYNYPDFKTLFNKFQYNNSVKINKDELTTLLGKIIRVDSKISKATVTLSDNIYISSNSLDTGSQLKGHLENVIFENEMKTPISFAISPSVFNKSLSDMADEITIHFNTESKVPLMSTDGYIKRYLVIMGE